MEYRNSQKTSDLFKGQRWTIGQTRYGKAVLVGGKLIRCSVNVTSENIADSLISICHLNDDERKDGQKADFLLIHRPADYGKCMEAVEGTGTF